VTMIQACEVLRLSVVMSLSGMRGSEHEAEKHGES
jgi:hypothetical protein